MNTTTDQTLEIGATQSTSYSGLAEYEWHLALCRRAGRLAVDEHGEDLRRLAE